METTSSNFAAQLAKYLPKPAKIYYYHFITETTHLVKGKKEWQKIERQVAIIYLGRKESFRWYQVVTPKIIFTSNKAFPNQLLLKEMGHIFDYIEVGVSNKGVIHKIFNIGDLKLRMQGIKSHLEKDHAGASFVELFNGIATILEDEKKTVQFVQSYKMFGLFFNGLYQQYQVDQPNLLIKPKVLDDFGKLEIQEEISFTENNNNYTFTIKEKSQEEKTEKYEGGYTTEYNQLLKGFITLENQETNIKYSVSWVG